MQWAAEPGDVCSPAAPWHEYLARQLSSVGADIATREPITEVARFRAARSPAVNWFSVGVLTTTLSDDPALDETAATFGDQPAAVASGQSRRSAPPLSTADEWRYPRMPVQLSVRPEDLVPAGKLEYR